MDAVPTVAESLPLLYRRVLDAAARLTVLGARGDAERVRTTAIGAYSQAWDERTRRRLEEILARAEGKVAQLEAERRSRLRIA